MLILVGRKQKEKEGGFERHWKRRDPSEAKKGRHHGGGDAKNTVIGPPRRIDNCDNWSDGGARDSSSPRGGKKGEMEMKVEMKAMVTVMQQ